MQPITRARALLALMNARRDEFNPDQPRSADGKWGGGGGGVAGIFSKRGGDGGGGVATGGGTRGGGEAKSGAHEIVSKRMQRASDLTKSADAETARLKASGGSKAEHDRAASLHGEALTEHRALGTGLAQYHSEHYVNHANKGSGIDAHERAAKASDRAETASYMVHAGGSHSEAQRAHAAAAQANSAVGRYQTALYHSNQAVAHAQSSAAASTASTLSRVAMNTKGKGATDAHTNAAKAHEAAHQISSDEAHARAAEHHRALAAGKKISRESMSDLKTIANRKE